MGISNSDGYWGPPTSSIDWCEENYVVSYYIAEFFNSFSSFAMILLGEAACYSIGRLQSSMASSGTTSSSGGSSSHTTPGVAAPSLFRFKLAFRTITVVGIGSFLFHATLLHHMQMLDELPMLYSVLALFFCLIESRFGPQPAWFPILLTVHGMLVTFLVAFTEGNTQFYSFHVTFGSLEFVTLYLVYRVYRARKAEYPDVKQAFEVGIGLYALAIAVWMIDLNFCEAPLLAWLPQGLQMQIRDATSGRWIVMDLYLHAWWHTFVSMGLYLLSTVIMLDGLIVQGWKPKIEMKAGGWLPMVTVVGAIDKTASKKNE
ncbi:ceramidase [Gamsiella multidivaricata]|uniref:ceramidase n=1 Tax=Gamsiella multidivaricata TaxID=101098 RepID=UPI0022210B2E|nr:ceramidase [Gamsiella multidivaricata]KAG0364760.1 Alkaline ceramidase 3 [Gamsiella multidivaricata]KAI7826971.1 ceramidase [Gamsiella multidivaricata]